jgi:hypothetical protein
MSPSCNDLIAALSMSAKRLPLHLLFAARLDALPPPPDAARGLDCRLPRTWASQSFIAQRLYLPTVVHSAQRVGRFTRSSTGRQVFNSS